MASDHTPAGSSTMGITQKMASCSHYSPKIAGVPRKMGPIGGMGVVWDPFSPITGKLPNGLVHGRKGRARYLSTGGPWRRYLGNAFRWRTNGATMAHIAYAIESIQSIALAARSWTRQRRDIAYKPLILLVFHVVDGLAIHPICIEIPLFIGLGRMIYDRKLFRIDSGAPLIVQLKDLLGCGQPMTP